MSTTTPAADPSTTGPRAAFVTGVRGVVPLLLGVVPFGLVAGVAAVEAGLGLPGAIGFSVVVFAGASQLAAIDLLAQGAPVVVAIGTILVINLRMLMYSASIAPELAPLARRTRIASAYLLTDQAYAVSILEFRTGRWNLRQRLALYLGAGCTLWVTWQVSTIVGALGGGVIPDSIPLGFAVPLAFLSLLVPAVTDRPTLVAALVGGLVATVGHDLPANLGMPLGAFGGVAAGWWASRRVGVAAPNTPEDTPGAGTTAGDGPGGPP